MYMQLNEQFIVDESGSKQAVWQTDKGSPQVMQSWFASQRHQQLPTGDAIAIQRTVDELREDWGDNE